MDRQVVSELGEASLLLGMQAGRMMGITGSASLQGTRGRCVVESG